MEALRRTAVRSMFVVAAALVGVTTAQAGVSCHKINAKGKGQDYGNGTTTAQIIGGGLLHGTTAGSFNVVGGAYPVFLITGTVTFNTVQGATLTVQVGGSFDVSDPSDAEFVVSGPVSSATGKLAGATGTLMISGDEVLGTGKFTEEISGLICVNLAP